MRNLLKRFFWKVAWHVWSAAQPGTPWQEPHYNLYTRSTMMMIMTMIIINMMKVVFLDCCKFLNGNYDKYGVHEWCQNKKQKKMPCSYPWPSQNSDDKNDNLDLNFSVPHESFDEDEIRNMRTEALTGSITTYTSGESWSNKGA